MLLFHVTHLMMKYLWIDTSTTHHHRRSPLVPISNRISLCDAMRSKNLWGAIMIKIKISPISSSNCIFFRAVVCSSGCCCFFRLKEPFVPSTMRRYNEISLLIPSSSIFEWFVKKNWVHVHHNGSQYNSDDASLLKSEKNSLGNECFRIKLRKDKQKKKWIIKQCENMLCRCLSAYMRMSHAVTNLWWWEKIFSLRSF